MRKNAVIKNIKKFNDIKLAKGLDLCKFSARPRVVEHLNKGGISLREYKDVWFSTPKGDGLFKTYSGWYAQGVRNARIVNEVLCEILCGQVGIPCAKYEPASLHEKDGLVTYNFLKENQILVTLDELIHKTKCYQGNCMATVVEALKVLEKNGIKVDKKQIIVELFKMSLFDAITLQTDRHGTNVNFVYDKTTNTFLPCPLFDNELAFLTSLLGTRAEKDEVAFSKLMVWHNSLSLLFTMKQSQDYDDNLESMVELSKKYPDLGKEFEKIVENIDIKSAIKQAQNLGYIISKNYKKYIENVVEYTTSKIKELSKNCQNISQDEQELF